MRKEHKDIIVTISKIELDDILEKVKQGDNFYFRTLKQKPRFFEEYITDIFFVEGGYIRGYCSIADIIEGEGVCPKTGQKLGEGYHIILRTDWYWITPVSMKGFGGWRYFDRRKHHYALAGRSKDSQPLTETQLDSKLLTAIGLFLKQLKKRDPRKGVKRKKYSYNIASGLILICVPETNRHYPYRYPCAICIKTGDIFGKSDNGWLPREKYTKSKRLGNVFDWVEDKLWDKGHIVWDGYALKIKNGHCDECDKTKGVKKLTERDLTGLSEFSIKRYKDKLLCAYCQAKLTKDRRWKLYEQKKRDQLAKTCKLHDKPITEYIEKLFDLLFKYGPKKQYGERVKRTGYAYYVKRNGAIHINAISYQYWILLKNGDLFHQTAKGKPMRTRYYGNIADLVDERKWKDGTITYTDERFNTPMTRRKCSCGSTDGVTETVCGLRCKRCRFGDLAHIRTIRALGHTPRVNGVPFDNYDL